MSVLPGTRLALYSLDTGAEIWVRLGGDGEFQRYTEPLLLTFGVCEVHCYAVALGYAPSVTECFQYYVLPDPGACAVPTVTLTPEDGGFRLAMAAGEDAAVSYSFAWDTKPDTPLVTSVYDGAVTIPRPEGARVLYVEAFAIALSNGRRSAVVLTLAVAEG